MEAVAGIEDADLIEPIDAFVIDAVAGHIGAVEADGFGVLGVDGDGKAEAGGDFHALAERGWAGGLEFIDTGGAHERFEADGSDVGHCFHVVERIGCKSAPEREVEA